MTPGDGVDPAPERARPVGNPAEVAALLRAQQEGAGGYDDDSDPEVLPIIVLRPGWSR